MFEMKNKNVIITGGHGHLGCSMTECLADAGANISIFGRNRNKFNKIFNKNKVNNIQFFQVDISKTNEIKRGISEHIELFGNIDVLINNSYYCKSSKNPEKMTDDEWEYGIDGTLNSVYRCIRESLDYMQAGSSIINISSMYGIISPDFKIYEENKNFINPPNYGASKAGVIQLTKYFASYLAEKNIRVNAISPGAFPSNEVQKEKIFIKNLIKKIPMKRIGKPDDIKGMILLLASDASQYITGQNFSIDGGWTII